MVKNFTTQRSIISFFDNIRSFYLKNLQEAKPKEENSFYNKRKWSISVIF